MQNRFPPLAPPTPATAQRDLAALLASLPWSEFLALGVVLVLLMVR